MIFVGSQPHTLRNCDHCRMAISDCTIFFGIGEDPLHILLHHLGLSPIQSNLFNCVTKKRIQCLPFAFPRLCEEFFNPQTRAFQFEPGVLFAFHHRSPHHHPTASAAGHPSLIITRLLRLQRVLQELRALQRSPKRT